MEKEIRSFEELEEEALKLSGECGKVVLAVICAEESETLKAIHSVKKRGIIDGILIGNKEKIEDICKKEGIPLSDFEIMDSSDEVDASRKGVKLVREEKADFLMKGLLPTSVLMKAVLDKENGLRTERIMSHVAVLKPPDYKLLLMSDSGINVKPDPERKIEIIKNAVEVAHILGKKKPKVALLTALDKVTEKMPATIEAAKVVELWKKEKIKDAIVEGPLAFDDAISKHAASVKNLEGEVPGDADILIVDDVEVGNALYKALVYFSPTRICGVVYGAKAPVVLGSRSDNEDIRFYSIVLGAYIMYSKRRNSYDRD
ncbi:MAG TPA: bifunctional enoyl-CoA hydratase/phosphate acetyltransferase [bacterium]|nr:bifunctional enoyl-CoA hydratase/phosphate acetyltransferase [bacterium]